MFILIFEMNYFLTKFVSGENMLCDNNIEFWPGLHETFHVKRLFRMSKSVS